MKSKSTLPISKFIIAISFFLFPLISVAQDEFFDDTPDTVSIDYNQVVFVLIGIFLAYYFLKHSISDEKHIIKRHTKNRNPTIMKNLIVLIVFLSTFLGSAQSVGINTDGSTAEPSAMLDVSSTTKGFLPPRMTTAQRNMITSPATGLMIFCTNCGDNGELQVYEGSSWTKVGVTQGTTQGQMRYWNGTKWVLISTGTEGQSLQLANGIPTWSN
jgi:hypothetical protein